MCRMTRRMLCLTLTLALTALLASCGSGSDEDEEYEGYNLFYSTVNSEHTLAFNDATNPQLYGWGANGWGQLGLGTRRDSNSPKPVLMLTGVSKYTQVSIGGGFGVAIGDDGVVYAWGHNTSGQLGDNTLTTRSRPAPVLDTDEATSLSGVTAVAAGGNHCLALKSNGTLLAWGSNTKGQLGNNSTTTSKFAIEVDTTGITDEIVAIAAGGEFSLALTSTGKVYAWGSNAKGQLGNGTTTTSKVPVQVKQRSGAADSYTYTELGNIDQIAAGGSHALAIDGAGKIWAWGYNGFGQLGDGTKTSSMGAVPVKLELKDDQNPVIAWTATDISAGLDHSLAVISYGDGTQIIRVYAWGYNKYGQLGNGGVLGSDAAVTKPQEVKVMVKSTEGLSPLTDITSVTTQGHHSLARGSNNELYSWGKNNRGQLGDGTRTSRSYAVKVDF